MALAMAVLVTAGLMLRSFIGLTHVDLGFDPHNVEAVPINLQTPQFDTFDTEQHALTAVVARLNQLPGVAGVAIAAHLPFSNDSSMPVSIRSGETPTLATLSVVGPGYLQTLHIPLLRGRDVAASDTAHSAPIALVNATFAQRFFGTTDVVGRSLYADSTALRIVGVTGDTRKTLANPPPPRVYLPVAQVPGFRGYELAVRTLPGRRVGASVIDAAVVSANPAIPKPAVRSLDDIVAFSSAHARAATMLFIVLAFVGLMLALSGLYAITSFGVERRTREFGIRRAVGARSANVLGNVLREALLNAGGGIAIGIVLVALFARWLDTVLYQTSPLDPLTFGAAVLLLVACALFAALAPAMRAIRIQPARALRYE
jgi:predicted permease